VKNYFTKWCFRATNSLVLKINTSQIEINSVCFLRYRLVSLYMRNPIVTKEKILAVSASLFNVQGFKATSISDITEATGFTKGAIYRHFEDKEALEECTFEFIAKLMQERLTKVLKAQPTAPQKLIAMCDFFKAYLHNPVIAGGCPILNAGVETDDTRPGLNKRVRQLLDTFQHSLEHIIRRGIEFGQIKPDTDPAFFATLFIASLEGGVLLSKIRNRTQDLEIIITSLQANITSIST
jgi:TetR/AcrR family transcriptional regulator, transcriptional repressor for nem operon